MTAMLACICGAACVTVSSSVSSSFSPGASIRLRLGL